MVTLDQPGKKRHILPKPPQTFCTKFTTRTLLKLFFPIPGSTFIP